MLIGRTGRSFRDDRGELTGIKAGTSSSEIIVKKDRPTRLSCLVESVVSSERGSLIDESEPGNERGVKSRIIIYCSYLRYVKVRQTYRD